MIDKITYLLNKVIYNHINLMAIGLYSIQIDKKYIKFKLYRGIVLLYMVVKFLQELRVFSQPLNSNHVMFSLIKFTQEAEISCNPKLKLNL